MAQESPTDAQVLQEVRDLARQGKIGWTTHADERMVERGYERGQVKECLMTGYFIEQPVIPNRAGGIQYTFLIRGHVDGETIDVAASLVPETKVVVITVIDPNN